MADTPPFPFTELRLGLLVTLHGKPYRVTHVPATYGKNGGALVHLAGEAPGVADVRWCLRIVLAHLTLTPGKEQPKS